LIGLENVGSDLQKEKPEMNPVRKAMIAVAMVGTTLTGGAIGAALFTGSSSNAATTTPTTTPASSSSGSTSATPGGTFHPNEDATHEAGESAAREAQENAGQVPTVP
jgi:hypothetical protein